MTQNKTQPTDGSVKDFLADAQPAQRREDGAKLLALMREITGVEPVMWGPSIIGFGSVEYHYESGRSGTMPRIGFSPRKAALSLYGLTDHPASSAMLNELGPHTTGVACLYIKRLADIDQEVLEDLIEAGWTHAVST